MQDENKHTPITQGAENLCISFHGYFLGEIEKRKSSNIIWPIVEKCRALVPLQIIISEICRNLRRRVSNKALALIYRAIGRIPQAVSETRHNDIASLSIEMFVTNWQYVHLNMEECIS